MVWRNGRSDQNSKKISLILISSILSLACLLSSQSRAASATPSVAATESTAAPTYTLPAGSSGGGSNSGGASAAGSGAGATQMLGAAMNVGFAGYMATQCKGSPMACMIAMQAGMQALSMLGNSSGSKNAGDAMAGTGSGTGLTYGAATDGSTGVSGTSVGDTSASLTGADGLSKTAVAAQIAALQSDLAKTGTTLSTDGKTITLPDGRQVPSNTGASAGNLSSAGFSQSEIDSGLAAVTAGQAKVSEKFQSMKVAGVGGDAGGGGGGAKTAGASEGPDYAAMMRAMNQSKSGKKASVAGMSKKLGADNIGVAGDDIFEMITRRYKARENSNAFFK